jgi:UPF0042 nucleotide-binding protein
VGAYIRADDDCEAYLSRIADLVDLVLPRFVSEGKKYATIAIGCTGGRHRSVYLIERLATHLASRLAAMKAAGEIELEWRQTVTHRELSGQTGQSRVQEPRGEDVTTGGVPVNSDPDRNGTRTEVKADGDGEPATPVQAQEA